MKRALDLLMAGLGLLVALPVLAVLAVCIKLDSPGPVFFRQVRVGRGGREFRIHKFRTMRVGEAGAAVTIGQDPRITRVGRVLRRTKLDEVPQLLDVLQGTMSVVGPRPEVPEYVALWPGEARDEVLSVRPGITDPAALEFHDESELLATQDDPETYYREVVTPAKLSLYREYIARATVWSDLVFVFRTVSLVATGALPTTPTRSSARAVLAGVGFYVAVLFIMYRFYFSEIWYYEGLTWRTPSPFGMVVALLCIAACAWAMPRVYARVSDVCLWLIFTIAVIPSILVAQWSERLSTGDATVLSLALTGGMLLLRLLTAREPFGLLPDVHPGRWFWIVGGVLSIGIYVWLFSIVDVRIGYLSFSDVYAVRAEFKDAFLESGALPYLFPVTYAVLNPLLIGVGLIKRSWVLVVVGVLAQTLVYLATGAKIALLAVPFVLLLAWMTQSHRMWPVWRLPVLWAFLVVGGRIMDGITGNLMWSAVASIRFLMIPGVLTAGYVSYFQTHPHVNFADALPFVDSPYTEDPFVLVGELLFGTEGTNANVNFFGDGFMNFGYLGLFVEVIVVAVLLRVADESTVRVPLPIACAIFAVPTISLTNGGAFTSILTYGFGAACVAAWLCPIRDTKPVGSRLDPSRVWARTRRRAKSQ